MRFILNFFFFGLLFYLIYLFFPEAFHTLVSWADRTYEFIKEGILNISDRIHHHRETTQQVLLGFSWKKWFN